MWTTRRLTGAALTCALAALLMGTRSPAGERKGATPLATATQESGLLVEILEVKADSNELLTIRWRYRNPTTKTIELFAATPPAPYAFNAPKNIPLNLYRSAYYVEGKFQSDRAVKQYIVIEQGTKRRYAKPLGRAAVRLRPEQQFEVWAKFAPPTTMAERITLYVPGTPLIENVPVGRD
jgi:hypothetical protein